MLCLVLGDERSDLNQSATFSSKWVLFAIVPLGALCPRTYSQRPDIANPVKQLSYTPSTIGITMTSQGIRDDPKNFFLISIRGSSGLQEVTAMPGVGGVKDS